MNPQLESRLGLGLGLGLELGSGLRLDLGSRLGLGLGLRLALGLGLDTVRGSTISHKMKLLPARASCFSVLIKRDVGSGYEIEGRTFKTKTFFRWPIFEFIDVDSRFSLDKLIDVTRYVNKDSLRSFRKTAGWKRIFLN